MILSLPTAMVSASIGAALLAAALTYLGRMPGAPAGLFWWASGFWLSTLRFAAYFAAPWIGSLAAHVLSEIMQASTSVFLLAGTMVYLGREVRPRWVAGGCIAVVAWVLGTAIAEVPFLVWSLPLYLAVGAAMVFAGVLLLRSAPESRPAGYRLTGLAFVLWGLHRMDYPFLRPVEWFAPYGFLIAFALSLAIAVGLIVIAQQSLLSRMEAEVALRERAEAAANQQRDFLQTVLDAVPVPFFVKDTAGVLTAVNDAFAVLCRLPKDRILGRTARDLAPTEAADSVEEADRALLAAGGTITDELRLPDENGVLRDYAVSKAVFAGPDGRPAGIAGAMLDITGLRRTEAALHESERRFREFAEVSSDWLWETDENDRFTFFSNRGAEIVGLDPSSYIGRTRFEATVEDKSSEKWRRHRADIAARRPIRDFRYEMPGPGGEMFTVTVNGNPVFDRDGRFRGYRGTGANVTEQRRAEQARDRALMEAERANRAKSEFLATMSHEFRTPLNAILGFSEMLREQYFGPLGASSYREYAAAIHDSGRLMLALVNDILDISAIEAGKRPFEKVEVEIAPLLRDCLKEVETAAADKRIALSLEIGEGPSSILADDRSLRQIALNLLSNAIKFTEPDGHVRLQAAAAPGGPYRIAVADDGIGIPADRIATVTEPFYQANPNSHQSRQGSGLGLSIVKALVEAHDGTLTIQSELGRGTTVAIELPAARH